MFFERFIDENFAYLSYTVLSRVGDLYAEYQKPVSDLWNYGEMQRDMVVLHLVFLTKNWHGVMS